jgi:hypothetical protein
MFRKTLFWGLTLMLVAVIVSLVIRSRRAEKKHAQAVMEVVQQSKPSATRVLSPQDLVIVEAKMDLAGGDGKPLAKDRNLATAHHQVVVRNNGPVAYSNVQLKFMYLGRGDKVLESKTFIVAKPIPPGQTVSLGDISIESVPAAATHCTTRILYADLK